MNPWLDDGDVRLYHGDAATVLAGTTLDGTVLAGDQFTLVIRSPQQQVARGRFVPGRMR